MTILLGAAFGFAAPPALASPSAQAAINDEVTGTSIVVFRKPATASALDSGAIAEERNVGSAAVFERRNGDRLLPYTANGDGAFAAAETVPAWTILGEAIAGPLQG